VNVSRFFVGFIVIGLFMLVTRRSFALPRSAWPAVVALAIALAAMTLGYVTSVAFIPVGLAALLFYTYPLMVAAIAPRLEGRPLGRAMQATFLLAFLGLGLAIGPSFQQLDWRGIALALAGAAGATGIFLASRKLVQSTPVLTAAFYSNLIGAGLLLAAMTAFGELLLPRASSGWWALAAAGGFYILAVATQLLALRFLEAARAAVIFNLEPLVSIAFAALLLGERLTLLQSLGVLLTIAALLAAARLGSRQT
jgi:drug/metabolite transporter (DMT)-like permease